MFTRNFKLTFNLIPDDFDGDEIEDMRTLDYSEIERGNLRCFEDWAAYADKEYAGFDDDDVLIDVSDGGSFGNVTIVSNLPFETIVHTYDGDNTLEKAIIDYMNGQISDGIGENEVGYAKYNGHTYAVWLNDVKQLK